MTDEQEGCWWDAVDDGCRILVHALMIVLTWPVWLLGTLAQAIETRRAETSGSVEDESADPQGCAQVMSHD